MKFEIGKAYKHNRGMTVFICGTVDTCMWGNTLIAEYNEEKKSPELRPFGREEAYNWTEITREEFMKENYGYSKPRRVIK